MKTSFKNFALVASLALPMFAVAGVARADSILPEVHGLALHNSDEAYVAPRHVARTTRSVYDAQASIDYPRANVAAHNDGIYQGGPRNGTGFFH